MSKLYTKTGDGGMTYLYDGSRRKKNSMFFDVLGDIDELSSHIGMLCAIISDVEVKNNWCTTISNFFKNDSSIVDYSSCDYSSCDYSDCKDTQTKLTILRDIQVKLLDIGSNIAVVDYTKKDKVPKLTEDDVKKLESLIDLYDIVKVFTRNAIFNSQNKLSFMIDEKGCSDDFFSNYYNTKNKVTIIEEDFGEKVNLIFYSNSY